MTKRGVFLVCLLVASLAWRANAAQAAVLNRDTARGFAALAINCVHREFPNKITHVLFSVSDVAPPHILTPAFFGCFDWHSAVHAHWLLARLARKFPQAEFATIDRSVLNIDLRPKNIAAEARYLKPRQGFERPYGLAWLLQLDSELLDWPDADAQRWHEALRPLVAVAVAHISDWLPKLDHPIRIGEHAQTAFALGLARDWAVAAGDTRFLRLIDQRARYYYAGDIRCPLRYEPSGHDFLSPCMAEADLMRRVLSSDEFPVWLSGFLPEIPRDGSADWLKLAQVTDVTDGKLVHLDGLNLSRAWMLQGIASALPLDDPRRVSLLVEGQRHAVMGIAKVSGDHYEGGHWLASFATYLLTQRGLGTKRPSVVPHSMAAKTK